MVLNFCLVYALIILIGGIISFSLRENTRVPILIAFFSGILFCLLLIKWNLISSIPIVNLFKWQLPLANMKVGIDFLSAFFMLPLLILVMSCSLYGTRYFIHSVNRTHWLFYSLLISSMIFVLLSRNAFLFLISWEIMSLSSFFLVITEKEKAENIEAGIIYFITAHIGSAFLIALFFILYSLTGSLDFEVWKDFTFSKGMENALFIFVLIAFGLKAGFIPFHVWLPLAHPAAPSHVSALMSGIMIKMGIYGIIRFLTLFTPHPWWGFLLVFVGSISGIMGVLFALGQHNIKRLLAYHSVENIGIILLGIGLGIVGLAFNNNLLAIYGFSGGILHVFNHALFKSLLFMGAGSVIRQTGTGEMDRLGGIIKVMPKTSILFLIGSAAICGLPFFNGFISEFLIYVGSINAISSLSNNIIILFSMIIILSLALIGGLAIACFTKLFGIVFLGEPRNNKFLPKEEAPYLMIGGMAIPAFLCFLTGIVSPLILKYLKDVQIFIIREDMLFDKWNELISLNWKISFVLISISLLIFIFYLFKITLLKDKKRESLTWDCGYISPTSSMQYTSSSFADPIINYFSKILDYKDNLTKDNKFWSKNRWSFHSSVNDWFLSRFYYPIISYIGKTFFALRWFQCGKIGYYVLYVVIILLALMLWRITL